jgi:hypothetical protein
MARKAVEDAVVARLAANFSDAPILDTNEDAFTPSDGTKWVRVYFPVSNVVPLTYAHSNSENGSFRIVVATEILSGKTPGLTLCETIAAIFSRQKFSGVTCFVPSISEARDDGNYYKRSVIVPYRFEFT